MNEKKYLHKIHTYIIYNEENLKKLCGNLQSDSYDRILYDGKTIQRFNGMVPEVLKKALKELGGFKIDPVIESKYATAKIKELCTYAVRIRKRKSHGHIRITLLFEENVDNDEKIIKDFDKKMEKDYNIKLLPIAGKRDCERHEERK